ncbi:MAG: hypothetical protein EBU84_11775 [Actinobacteria bacterium]|nr:hypothetical protein [Actinomycetota bacterium]
MERETVVAAVDGDSIARRAQSFDSVKAEGNRTPRAVRGDRDDVGQDAAHGNVQRGGIGGAEVTLPEEEVTLAVNS